MPLSTTISLPLDVQQQIDSAAGTLGIDPLISEALAQVVSGGMQRNPDGTLFVSNYGIGVMGLSISIGNALGFDVRDKAQNILAGVTYLQSLVTQFVGNYSLAVAAYLSSPNLVLISNGIPPLPQVQAAVYNVTLLAQNAGSSLVSISRTFRSGTTADPEPSSSAAQNIISKQTTGTDYGQISAQNTALLAQSLVPVLQDDTGLDETAWFMNNKLITGNPSIRQRVQPVSFMVFLNRNDRHQVLHKPNTDQPIILELNTSLKEFSIESKHIYNRQPSRTGQHVTLWGMQPDLFQGSGTTGVFMNQFGITDYFSTSDVPDVVKQQIRQVFLGNAGRPNAAGSILNAPLINIPEALRVAAQDAFIEFMKLFQMNGNVWYHTQNYQGVLTDQEQQSPNAWSPKVGASSFQQHSRNNDVMTRGFIAMRFKNNVYLGYFKSLNWTQDAGKPFSWDFSFTFQIEKTYSAVYWPSTPANQDIKNTPPLLTSNPEVVA